MTNTISAATTTRDAIVRIGKSLFDRGLTAGATGNISVRLEDGTMLMTPTNCSLGSLEADRLSHVDADGALISGDAPTKEAFLHRCMYCERSGDSAVVHLHSTHAVAASILADVDPDNVLPPLTAYQVMRVGTLPLVPYYPPGDVALAAAVRSKAGKYHALLLANHGPIVSGRSIEEAQYAIEELEETARLFLMLRGERLRLLDADQVATLRPVSR